MYLQSELVGVCVSVYLYDLRGEYYYCVAIKRSDQETAKFMATV